MKIGDTISWMTAPGVQYKIVGERGDYFRLKMTKHSDRTYSDMEPILWPKEYCRNSAKVIQTKPKRVSHLPDWF